MLIGTQLQIWWCGQARNPQKDSQDGDAILYASIDTTSGRRTNPVTVLAETPGGWDAAFVCNPRVIGGVFVNPLGDGKTYSYAMYYVGTADPAGVLNNIGVAFSNDGLQWNKYKDPVYLAVAGIFYGVGHPSEYSTDGKSNLVVLFEDTNTAIEHFKTTTPDGIHFTLPAKLTGTGLDPNNPAPSWGDIGFDPVTQYWYAAYDLPLRNKATTGGQQEYGQYGIQLYRIPDTSLLNGAAPWQLLKTIDTNATGYESNFLAGFLKDKYGNVNVGAYPDIQIYPSIANPATHWADDPEALGEAGGLIQWDVGSFLWKPGSPQLALTRYKNSDTYDTTTGYLDPHGHFAVDTVIAHLYEGVENGPSVPFFNCKTGSKDYFVSLDSTCAGSYVVGLEGYGYPAPAANGATVAIYSCSSAQGGHFASKDAQCEGSGPGSLLGYGLR